MSVVSSKCRARGGAAACTDLNCPEKRRTRQEFFAEVAKQPQRLSFEAHHTVTDAYNSSKQELSALTAQQREAIRFFSQVEFGWINGHLYGDKRYKLKPSKVPHQNFIMGSTNTTGIGVFDTRTLEHFEEITTHLDAALKSTNAAGIQRKVYRGQSDIAFKIYAGRPVSESPKGRAKAWLRANISVGQELTIAGYQSTSLNPAVAARFAENDGLLFEIMTSKGINITSASLHRSEQEVLLPRNAHYRVLEVREDVTIKLNRGSKKVNLIRLEEL